MAFDYKKYLEKRKKEKKLFDTTVTIEKPILLSRKRTRTRLAGGDFKEHYVAESVGN